MAKSTGVTAKNETLTEYLKRKVLEANKEFDLPSGLKCRVTYFSGAKALRMNEITGDSKDNMLAMGAIINLCCEFSHDGVTWSRIIPEEANELLHGADYSMVLEKLDGTSSAEGK
jgi:hypothetical protein